MLLAPGQAWHGDRLDAWFNQSAPTDANGARAVEITDGTPHLRLKALDSDVAPLTPNSNPRAQLCSPPLIEQGGTYRACVDLLIPGTSLPVSIDKAGGKWVEFVQFNCGPPFAGSPPLRIFTMDGATFGLRLADSAWGWSAPMDRDVWWRFVCEWEQATDGWYRLLVSRGLTSTPVEVVPQTSYATVQAANQSAPNMLILNAYMAAGTAPRIGQFFFHAPTLTRTA
jgi:hypothetical protein